MNTVKQMLQHCVDIVNMSRGFHSSEFIDISFLNGGLTTKAIPCQWGDGAEHKSAFICLSDARFGIQFLMQVNQILQSFMAEIHTSGHAADWTVLLEDGDVPCEVIRLVCRSGKFLTK